MLHVHVADRLEPLAEELARTLAEPLADVMATDWVAVPSAGMRRWLQLELARHLGAGSPGRGDGVVANIDMPYPGALRTAVLAAGRPADAPPDPWSVERLVWAILDVTDAHPGEACTAGIADTSRGRPRFGNARRVADLFDRYHVHRPQMIRHWADGRDLDGVARPLPEHHRWQPALWRLVRSHLGVPSPAERFPSRLEAVVADPSLLALPPRVALFGSAVLPGGAGFVDVVDAVAVHREVHLHLVTSSASVLRGDGRDPFEGPRQRSVVAFGGGSTAGHPLVRSWGRLHRETGLLVADAGWRPQVHPTTASDPSPTLLRQLQHDIRADATPDGSLPVAPNDRSVVVHACHGRSRQVEVLRDAVLGMLAADPTLREDDILVVCPSLERFAPTIEAVFGPSADRSRPEAHAGRPPALRYRVADRSMSSTNPVLAAMTDVLTLLAGRFDGPTVLDLCALAPVRHRYGFDDDALATIADWVDEANVRWGLDEAHRAELGLDTPTSANTWLAALDRVLLGVAVAEDDQALTIGATAPLGVEGDDAALAGRLADLMWRLGALLRVAGDEHPVAAWCAALHDVAEAIFAVPLDEAWQLDTLRRLVREPELDATGPTGPSPTRLTLADVRRLFGAKLAAEPGRPAFFVGGVTITSMTPMRWVPHRVVVLLGVDQAAFNARAASGDDLVAAEPLAGDGDPRAESRQALLECVLAAGDRLVVIRDGHDVRSNQEVPPAVVVAELVEALAATIETSCRAATMQRVEVQHPRQAFDERCFQAHADAPDPLLAAGPWGFDPSAFDAARARRERSFDPPVFLRELLPPDDREVIELSELHAFLKDPVTYFAERRLGVRIPRSRDELPTLLPTALDGLDGWAAGNRLLRELLAGGTTDRWAVVERRRGSAPHGVLGDTALAQIATNVEQLLGVARDLGVDPTAAELVPVEVELGDGTVVTGTVTCRLTPPTAGPARVEYTSEKSHHVLSSWLDLMVLEAHDPSRLWRAVSVNRLRQSGKEKPPTTVDLVSSALDASPAERRRHGVEALEVAVDCFRRGLREPIPLFPILSRRLHLGEAGYGDWQSYVGWAGDADRGATAMAFGHLEFEELIELERLAEDPAGAPARAQCFADHLWGAVWRTTRAPDATPAVPSGGGA